MKQRFFPFVFASHVRGRPIKPFVYVWYLLRSILDVPMLEDNFDAW
jgi:hypothetical protein